MPGVECSGSVVSKASRRPLGLLLTLERYALGNGADQKRGGGLDCTRVKREGNSRKKVRWRWGDESP